MKQNPAALQTKAGASWTMNASPNRATLSVRLAISTSVRAAVVLANAQLQSAPVQCFTAATENDASPKHVVPSAYRVSKCVRITIRIGRRWSANVYLAVTKLTSGAKIPNFACTSHAEPNARPASRRGSTIGAVIARR